MTCYKFNPLIGWNYSIYTGGQILWRIFFLKNKFSTNESTQIYNRSCDLYLQIPTENHPIHLFGTIRLFRIRIRVIKLKSSCDLTVLIYTLCYLRSYGKNPITRHPCNISEQEFVNLFVRKKLPVILTDCQAHCCQSHY